MRKQKIKKNVSKKPKVEAPKQKQTQKQIVNINIEKPKARKKRTVTKQEQKPITQYYQPSIDQSMRHKRGSMNIDLQQPTIIQQPLIDPELKFKLDKLERRTQKIKEGLKQNQPVNVTVPQIAKLKETPARGETVQQSIIGTGIVDEKSDVFSDAIETPVKPKKLDFDKPKSMFSRLLSPFRISRPKALTGPKEFPLLEYSSRSEETLPHTGGIVGGAVPSTAPTYVETPTGKIINEELQLLIRQLHAAHPNSKIHRNTIRSAVSRKLKELGVGPQHTDKYEKDMREYYAKIFEERQFAGVRDEVTAAEPQKDVLKTKRKKDKKINLSPVPESLLLSTPASI